MAKVLKEVSKISGAFGQEGEERMAELLANSLPDNYLILNSPRIAYREDIVDIDHIVITPYGVFVIESKNMNGKITGGLMGNWVQERLVGGRLELVKIGNPASQVNQYAKIVRQYLKDEYLQRFGAAHNFKVEPVVVFVHDQSNINQMSYTHRGFIGKVRVCKAKELISYITSYQKEFFTSEDMAWCADALIPPDQRDQTGIYSSLLTKALRESFQGRFQMLEEIGDGNFGTVYKSYDTKLDRAVAIKKLHTRKKTDEVIKRFNREARASAKLRHENIVEFFDYYEENGEFYIVMELINGKPLDEMIEEPMDLDELSDVFTDICSALQHAHDNGVIHRDLKAANIMLTDDGKVKITDFGVARIVGEEMQQTTHFSVGTPTIMAPEQVMGIQTDHRIDIFALGVLLYQLCTGKLPFTGQSIGEVVNNILKVDPVPPTQLNPNIPGSLERVILKALAKEPEDRYATAREMAEEFYSSLDPDQQDVYSGTWEKWRNKLKRFWRDDRLKFQAVSIITIAAFAWFFSSQAYMDAKSVEDKYSILQSNPASMRSKIVTNNNLATVVNNFSGYMGAKVHLNGKLNRIVSAVNNSVLVEMLIPQDEGQPISMLVVFNGNPHSWIDKHDSGDELHVTGKLDKIQGLDQQAARPLVVADTIQAMEPWAELAPSILTLQVDKTTNRQGKEVTLKRIEFAESETRLYVKVENKNKESAHLSLGNPVGIQNGKEIGQLYKTEGNFEFELRAGQISEGIVYLQPMDMMLGTAQIKLGDGLSQEPFSFDVRWATE